MAEQVFRSPGYFDREIDQSQTPVTGPNGVPAGVIGTSDKGPAFVPVTVASFSEFRQKFGDLNPKKVATYAVNEFLNHRTSLTFMRVLGAGSFDSSTDVSNYLTTGQARNAGFIVTGTNTPAGTRHMGAVQLLCARHTIQTDEQYGLPIFSNNSSVKGATTNLVRGVILMASGARMMVLDGNQSAIGAFSPGAPDDFASVTGDSFKLVISSTNGPTFGVTDGNPGIRIYTASLNPTSQNYFAKLLNTDPEKFAQYQHVVYSDFAVDAELATATTVAIASGSTNTSNTSANALMSFRDLYGHFDSPFVAPRTPMFISQPFGVIEHELFYFETLDDGAVSNNAYKISITGLKASTNDAYRYGSFTVLVRTWDDDDVNQNVVEQFPDCTLDPNSDRYIAKIIGDRKVRYDFNSEIATERRLVAGGKYNNNSNYVRVVVTEAVDRGLVPVTALPFGFEGVDVLKTNDNLNDFAVQSAPRLSYSSTSALQSLTGSIVPPIPFRFKITRGDVATGGFKGNPGQTEVVNGNYYWGVKFERNTQPLNPNVITEKNAVITAYSKLGGIKKLDALVTGSGASNFNNNKFTLAKVAFSNDSIAALTASVETHMKEVAYIRNANIDPTTYTINDGVLTSRLTFASLAAQTSPVAFNRFSPYAKFTTFFFGGFDGLNILDRDSARMSDKSVSFDAGGCADSNYISPGLAINASGVGVSNNSVAAYKTAVNIMTDAQVVNTNILAIPGIKESYITDYASQKTKTYGQAIYVMDIPSYDDNSNRLYDDSTVKPDVDKTSTLFAGRAVDNNYVATYFPDFYLDDAVNKRRVKVPASVAALAAYAYNDRVSFSWFAPAGFNRAALDFVTNVDVRLSSADRDAMSDARINPIATFPRQGFVIYGQKTLQQAHSALDRVNVRRLVLEIKRQVIEIAGSMVFEQNTPQLWQKFVSQAQERLGIIQLQSGIDQFKVIMDNTNNSETDKQENRVNGKIIFVPTRTFENIAIDFIISNNGINFLSP
jgi:hypothetical protein